MNDTPTTIKKFMSYGWCNIKGDYIPMGECVTAADHEHALTMLNIRYGAAAMHHADNMQEVTEQRNRLAAALARTRNMIKSHPDAAETCATEALQSLTKNGIIQ